MKVQIFFVLPIPFKFYQNHHEFSSRKAQAAQVQVVLSGQGELLGTSGSERYATCEFFLCQEKKGAKKVEMMGVSSIYITVTLW